MDRITSTIATIRPVDRTIMKYMRERQDSLAKPQGSLGRLEELSIRIAGIQRTGTPRIEDKWITIFAADHGIATQGVTSAPQQVTALQTQNFILGGAGINAIAQAEGISLSVTDIGIAYDYDRTGVRQHSLGRGTNNIAVEPAMTREQAVESIVIGIETVNEIEDLDILGTGEMGLGNTSASTAIFSVLLDLDIQMITGLGSGITDTMRDKKASLIRQAIDLHRPDSTDPIDVLAKVGGFEIGGMAGAMLAAAARQIPVVVDGYISSAAALIAIRLCPAIHEYLILSHHSAEKGHDLVFSKMGLTPLLDLGLRLGEGTGAALAINLCEAAVQAANRMITLKELAELGGG